MLSKKKKKRHAIRESEGLSMLSFICPIVHEFRQKDSEEH